MAIEYRLSHTASEIDRKLTTVGEIENSLKNKYYTSANVDAKIEEVNTSIEEVNTSIEGINTSLINKADLVDGKIPAEQLPDDIGGGAPAEHTHDISDIEGLLTEETFTTMDTLWEYSEDMVVDTVVEAISLQFYRFSDNTDLDSLIGVTITDTEGNAVKTTSEMVDSSTGLLHAINLPPQGLCCMVIVPNDFDLSVVGGSGMALAGSYAARDMSGKGAAKIQTEIEATKMSISNELFPSALQIGEIGTKIEWDGTPTEEFIDAMDTLHIKIYKVGKSISKEEIIGNTITMANGEIAIIDSSMIIDMGEMGYLVMDTNNGIVFAFVSFGAGEFDLSMFVPGLTLECSSSGLWFMYGGDSFYTNSLVGTDYQIKQLDPKYIPANLDFDLSDYYTKDEIDSMIGDCDIILNEISALIGE